MQKLQLNVDGAHEGDCKKPGEAFSAGQRNTCYCFINEHVVGKVRIIHPATYQSLNESLFYMEQIGFCLNLCQQAFKSSGFLSRVMYKES